MSKSKVMRGALAELYMVIIWMYGYICWVINPLPLGAATRGRKARAKVRPSGLLHSVPIQPLSIITHPCLSSSSVFLLYLIFAVMAHTCYIGIALQDLIVFNNVKLCCNTPPEYDTER